MRELSMHVLDLLQNAIEAGATRIEARIEEDGPSDRLLIEISDNGRGMNAEQVRAATDPFYTSRHTRRVGLGLPLLAAAAERTGGTLTVESTAGAGTKVRVTMGLGHIDRAPMGDLAGTLLGVLLHEPPVELTYTHHVDDRTFAFDTPSLRRELGDVQLSHPLVIRWLRGYLSESFAALYGGNGDAESQDS